MGKVRRDGLGKFCFYLHLAILIFITFGWLAPSHGVLISYLVFLPVVVLHWRFNGGNCVLNNLENWLRYRRWRVGAANPEEGAWLRTLIGSVTGMTFSKMGADILIYTAMTVFWVLAWLHLRQFQGS